MASHRWRSTLRCHPDLHRLPSLLDQLTAITNRIYGIDPIVIGEENNKSEAVYPAQHWSLVRTTTLIAI